MIHLKRFFYLALHPARTVKQLKKIVRINRTSVNDFEIIVDQFKILAKVNSLKFGPSTPIHKITWVCLPSSPEGGGIANISRFIREFNQMGVDQEILIWFGAGVEDLPGQRKVFYHGLGIPRTVPIKIFKMKHKADLVIATGWQTYAPASCLVPKERRVVFLQDRESSFEPLGEQSVFYEQALSLFNYAICYGPWLKDDAKNQGIPHISHFESGVDPVYFSSKFERRKEIVLYFQPDKARRMAGLAIASVEMALKRLPGWSAVLVGSKYEYGRNRKIGNVGIQNRLGLANLYRRASVGLVLSATNGSIVPPEMIACGLHVISNDGPNVRWLDSNQESIEFVECDPLRISEAIVDLATNHHYEERNQIHYMSWDEVLNSWKTQFLQSHKVTEFGKFLKSHVS